MPLPKPKDDEKEQDFIGRCMGDETMKDEYPDNDQRLAVCYSLWKDKEKAMPPSHRRCTMFGPPAEVQTRDDNKPVIVGYAAVFDQTTELWGFKERIAPGAFARALSEGQDVRALLNHDPNLVLGRTKNGTLELREDDNGLAYAIHVPETTAGRDAVELIKRGDVDQSSFAFSIRKEEWDDDQQTVTIREIDRLYDISPVTYPAYEGTSAQVRNALSSLGIENEEFTRILLRIGRGIPLSSKDAPVVRELIKYLRTSLPPCPSRERSRAILRAWAEKKRLDKAPKM